ncbi:MAG TPA: VVA0879 family protein [Pseudoxanthomonas sp.]|nr:VVA0879 family protein [Pseudoxanthomonas sp.]
MRQMTVEEFHAALKAQEVLEREDLALVCPLCKTVQSARDFIQAGAGADFESVERFLGFSCIGRFTGAASARRQPDGEPCDWTLGGLFQLHDLEVVTPDGVAHPRFEPATREQAQAHAAKAVPA